MEDHRLKEMPEGYDQKLFVELYKKTEPLRKTLAWGIDPRRLGMDYEGVLAEFDVKFIFAFSKYFGKMDKDLLLGHIINALQFYKNRILRKTYTVSNLYTKMADIEDLSILDSLPDEKEYNHNFETLLDAATSFIQNNLSEDARTVFEIQLNPPAFIIDQLDRLGKQNYDKIPAKIIADYLNFGSSDKAIKYVKSLRNEIEEVILLSREYFSTNPVVLAD